MKNHKYFQNSIHLVLLCIIVSIFFKNGTCIISDTESGLRQLMTKLRAGDDSTVFQCENGRHVISNFKCDGDNDCGDGSDERDCPAHHCTQDQFQCGSGKCVSNAQRCDGNVECRDKSDEASCTNCSSKAFTCRSGECVYGSFECNSRSDCSDGSDEICPEGLIPRIWQEHWHPNNADKLLTRAFSTDNIGIYFDPDMYKQTNWFFRPLSEAWNYATSTYGPIGTNPALYVALHDGSLGCVTASFFDIASGYRTLLDCGQLEHKWAQNTTTVFEALVSPLGGIVRDGAKSVLNDADHGICDEQIKNIFFYDIYAHLKGESSAEVLEWEARKEFESVNVEGNTRFCLRDWFFPIYKQFGKGVVLNNYLENTKSHWPQHSLTGYTAINMGQWVHFWSGSAGVDLQPLALKAFTWTTENQNELQQARRTYPTIRYPINNYTLAYDDKNIAVKFKNYQNMSSSIYRTLSDAWTYVKSAYKTHNVDLRLEIILEDQDDRFTSTDCTVISQNIKAAPSVGGEVKADSQQEPPYYEYTMKCGKSIFKNWGIISSGSGVLDEMFIQMAQLALNHILVTDDFPEDIKQIDKSIQPLISDLNLQSIIVYDMYVGLELSSDAERWRAEQSSKRINFPERSRHLFRDWYLEIYNSYDSTHTHRKIVTEFVQIVYEQLELATRKKTWRLNVGEFVHFWSGAVENDLTDLAKKCFKWKPESIRQFEEARRHFPGLHYECETCTDNTTPGLKETWEPQTGSSTIPIVIGAFATILVVAVVFFGIKFVIDRRQIQYLSKKLDTFPIINAVELNTDSAI